MTENRRIIGITGGVGAGKSSVLAILREDFGAHVILADEVAHTLMEPGSEGLAAVVQTLGDSFLAADGSVDRQKLAALLFRDDGARAALNAIIHPLTWKAIVSEAIAASERLIVIESAIFDTAPVGFFDELWYIYTTKENRIRRLMESRGYSREKCEAVIAAQYTEEQFRALCGRVIDNNGTEEDIRVQLKEILLV